MFFYTETHAIINCLISKILFHSFFNKNDFSTNFLSCILDVESSAVEIGSEFSLLSAYNILQSLIGSIANNVKNFSKLQTVSLEKQASFQNLKWLVQITIRFLFFSKSFGKDTQAKIRTSLYLKAYLENKNGIGVHLDYRRYSKRILKALQDILSAAIRILDTPESLVLQKSLKLYLTELQDFESLLHLFSNAEEKIHKYKVMNIHEMSSPSSRYQHGLDASLMDELIRRFCSAYPEKRSGLVAFVFPDLINEEIRRQCPNIRTH
jgi:hypothetical protein